MVYICIRYIIGYIYTHTYNIYILYSLYSLIQSLLAVGKPIPLPSPYGGDLR